MNILENIRRRKGTVSTPPGGITIGIGSPCNNKCLFCSYHGEDAKGISNVYNLPFMLSVEKFKKIVDMAKQGGGCRVYIYVQPESHF